MVDWEKEAKYWKEKYERQYHSWLSLRTCWNKLLREHYEEKRKKYLTKT